VTLQTVCVRHQPSDFADEKHDALDRHTLGWVERVNHSGAAYLTPALLDGRWMARVSIGAIQTERHHVEQVWEAMKKEAGRVADRHRIGHNH
jgi:aromatic-L-amino-acid decarboxylase